MPSRRDILLSAMLGSLATGLPAWFLRNPKSARAQDLDCAIAAQERLQYLICCVNSNGDPISNNCPGTYDDFGEHAALAIHPEDASMAATELSFGAQTFKAAAPWGNLSEKTRSRTAFFHHVTLANNHGDQPKVMRLMGATSENEMLLSAYAKHLGPCFGTVQTEPIAVGAGNNASELLSFSGRTLPAVSPTQLRQLLTGSSGGSTRPQGQGNQLVGLRQLRDQYLDRLHEMAKKDATSVQLKFLEAMSRSREQTRNLAEQLSETLSAINGDGVADQARAASALISANVSPVITVRLAFGGDDHSDSGLAAEVAQHTASDNGCAGIQLIADELENLGLSDKATFMTLNVFGRNLNGLSKTESRSGRDHYGNHSVAVLIGKNVNPGVYGGVRPVSDRGSNGALGASDIDSATGQSVEEGDIPRLKTHISMAKTCGMALGIPAEALEADFVESSPTKAVGAALV